MPNQQLLLAIYLEIMNSLAKVYYFIDFDYFW